MRIDPARLPVAVAVAIAVAVAMTFSSAPGYAEVAPGDSTPRGWYAGINLRTDYGTHRVRAGGGVRFGRLATTLVLDPKVLYDSKQQDIDGLAEWMFKRGGWSGLCGWRVTQLSIDRGTQYHHNLLLGTSGGLPALAGGTVRARFGLELEATILRHGAGIETDWISLASERHVRDLLSANLFLRFEYAAPL